MLFVKGEVLPTQNSGVYGDQPAIVVSDFNYVGNASALIKKGANESFNDVNDFRDIFVEAFKPIKEVQADIDPGESSKRTYIWLVWPPNNLYFRRTI